MELISVIGSGRSGSTFLEGLLHSATRVTAVGEVSQLWEKGLLRNELCGCGEPFSRCPFWDAVISSAFGRPTRSDAQQFDRIFTAARRGLLDGAMLLGVPTPRDPAFEQIAQPLYDSIWRIGGEHPILDSSKWPAYVAATRGLDHRAAHLIHMFRDARGNVHSYRNPKRRPQARSKDHEYLGASKSLYHAIGRWKLLNLQARRYARRQQGVATIMYEQLCNRPELILSKLIDMAALRPGPASGHWHSVSGNPVRFDPGKSEVSQDQRWRLEMKPIDRYITRLLTVVQQQGLEHAANRWLEAHGNAAALGSPLLRRVN